MTKEAKSGIKPPIIGKLTGRVRTPLSIFGAFFALGVLSDLAMEFLARNIKALQARVHVGFDFWFAWADKEAKYTLPDGTEVPWIRTIAYDDIILIFITLAIGAIYKIKLKWRLVAMAGFFTGWYASSMWISPRMPWPKPDEESSNSSTTTNTQETEEDYSVVEQ